MAPRRRAEMLLSMSLVVAFWGATLTLAQSQSQSQSQSQTQSSCTNVLISLSPCLDYITGNTSIPSSGCCSQLAYVVGSQPQCLCEVVNGGASSVGFILNINQTLALSLPSACRVQTPPISSCSGNASSSSTDASVSNFPNSPSGSGFNTFPSTTRGSGSGGGSSHENSSSTKFPCSLLVFFLFATTLTFTFMTTT